MWTIVLLLVLAMGCATAPSNHGAKILAVRFRTDPLDHKAEEAIEQVEISAWPASIYRIDKLPYDWCASASSPQSFEVRCSMGCGHLSSSISDIRALNDVVYIRVDSGSRKKLKVTARVWITRGPLGPGRIVTLESGQLALE
jgi:hypothetical protein